MLPLLLAGSLRSQGSALAAALISRLAAEVEGQLLASHCEHASIHF